jgi:uncharacterized repeat protein (TIGR02543 family)
LTYHWETDAATGGVFGWPDPYADNAVANANAAASFAWAHGDSLGPRLPLSLRRVHIIAHSAGAWAARETALSVLENNRFVVVQVTLLDPYVPDSVLPNSYNDSELNDLALADVLYSGRVSLLENYYADDSLIGGWNSTVTPAPTLGTQDTFAWRGNDINQRVDWGDIIVAPPGAHSPLYQQYYDWHSGPISFYADTLSAAGGSPPASLPTGSPFNYQQRGWYRSLWYRTQQGQLPRITTQPLGQSSTGASVVLSVVGAGSGPFNYQWYKNSSLIIGANSSSYTVSSSTDPPTPYVVRVNDASGNCVFSDRAVVTFYSAPPPPAAAPSVASVSPSTLPPSFATQLINIYGSNFKAAGDPNASSLIFRDPANIAYVRTPIFVSSSQLQYNITVQSAVGTWSVTVTNASQSASNLKTFLVAAPPPNTGSLTVNLFPAGAVSAGAQWQVDGGGYRNSGDTASGLVPGSHSVAFKAVSGYTTPTGHSVSISSGANTTDSGTYTVVTPSTYTLTLNYNPAQGGASPSPLVPETSHSYGSYSFGYAPGSVTLVQASASSGYHFTGWSGDASGTGNPITVTMNGNKNITANFALGDPNLGTLTVTIVPPEAAAAGVTWGFNESDFRTSGTSLQYWPGTYLIYVNGTSGWIGYPSWVTVIAGQTTSVSLPASSTTGTIIGNDPRTYITLAGAAETPGNADGVGSSARFNSPVGMTVDGAGNVFVTDTGSLVRKISPLGVVTTVAGQAGVSGYADGQGTNAVFNNLQGIAVDSSGNLYVSDMMNSVIRKITPGGAVSTFAGQSGINDSVDGTGSAARFYFPTGIGVDTSGNVYVSDSVNQTIRKITPSRAVTTLAGFPRSYGYADGTGSAARFHSPQGLAVDGSGNVYVAENSNETIRKVTPAGVVSTLAGFPGSAGAADGIGGAARFRFLNGLALDQTGNIYVADQGNEAVRKVTQGGVVTTVAGQSGNPGTADGIGSLARFNHPQGVAVDASGNLYVADSRNHTIRATTSVATKFDQTITFGTLPSKYINDLPFALTASASSALSVTFGMVSGPATLSNNVVTLTGAGTVTVRASQAGDATFNAATNVDRSFNVEKLPQTIVFGALSRQVLGDAPFGVSASASSGLAVTFSLLSGPAILSGNVVTITGAGLVVVRASQSGDSTYAAAPDVDQVFIVAPGNNVVTDCERVGNGMFRLRYYGDTGTNYVVVASTNLVNWVPMTTNQVGALGYLEFIDMSSTNFNRRFYRVGKP